MSYPQTAAALAANLAELTAERAGAHLAPSASPAGDEIALHAALRARGEVLALVRVIAADVAPVTDRQQVQRPTTISTQVPRAQVAEVMRLGRDPVVAAFADAVGAHPRVPLRAPDTDPATSPDPRVRAWVAAGEHALVAGAQYTRAGGATTDPARWSAAGDAAAFAQLLTHLDTDLATSVRAHALADPAAAGALDRARAAGPALAAAAQDVVELARPRQTVDYTAVELEPHRVVRVDSPATLVRGQRRLASLIAQTPALSPATISQIISDTERLNVAAAAALRETGPGRAAAARTTVRSLRAAAPHRAALVTELATLTRKDPAPALQSREIARYLCADPRIGPAALARAVDHTGAVLTAAGTSARASVASSTWWTSNPVIRDQGPLGAYPWQRADLAAISALLTRLNLAASHHATRAASPAPAAAVRTAHRRARRCARPWTTAPLSPARAVRASAADTRLAPLAPDRPRHPALPRLRSSSWPTHLHPPQPAALRRGWWVEVTRGRVRACQRAPSVRGHFPVSAFNYLALHSRGGSNSRGLLRVPAIKARLTHLNDEEPLRMLSSLQESARWSHEWWCASRRRSASTPPSTTGGTPVRRQAQPLPIAAIVEGRQSLPEPGVRPARSRPP